ncbi:hypothetical protein [Oenococcus oeni]|uniref:hypothetical protein n=1 Tax=Oenococcus oeni TaxID=1247 RepID=UPI0008F81203|nr:hypothetical protein [Oenococcus oeni]OIK95313.1 hypothetical protein ATW84_09605 [Oenococcus oeni]OIL75769.1 hypothetical protein ATX34_10300 [Oenococcus oeni]OIM78117.1 hypothetical protein ATX97_10490 [Oenococcus oeni]
MAITMYQADRNFVSPANDAALYSAILNNTSGVLANRGNNFALTIDGLVVSIDTGQAVIGGRLIEITALESVTVPANSSGSICLVVDLTKTNTVTGNAGDTTYSVAVNQVYTSAVIGSLTQDDLNDGGFIYELPLASFVSTATSVTLTDTTGYLNDTGWTPVSLIAGAIFGSNGYAQYRVRNGHVFIDFYNINPYKATNQNQAFIIPSAFAPSKNLSYFAMVSNSNGETTGMHARLGTIANTGLIYFNYDGTYNNEYGSGQLDYPLDK